MLAWTTAATTCAVGVTAAFFVGAVAFGRYGAGYCGTDGRLPAGATDHQLPDWVAPTAFRCEYAGHPDLLATEWLPLLWIAGWGLVTCVGIALAIWAVLRLGPRNLGRGRHRGLKASRARWSSPAPPGRLPSRLPVLAALLL